MSVVLAYQHIPFIICIAIAGHLVIMEAFGRQGRKFSTEPLSLSKQEEAAK